LLADELEDDSRGIQASGIRPARSAGAYCCPPGQLWSAPSSR